MLRCAQGNQHSWLTTDVLLTVDPFQFPDLMQVMVDVFGR
jgi:hypothetical protein